MTGPVIAGTDLARLRELNSLTVVRALRDQPPATVTEIARTTGLSRPAVTVLVQGLVSDGWAAGSEPGASSTVGRPARRFQFRATAGYVLGVDVGAHKILALVADLHGNVVHTARASVAAAAGPGERLAALDRTITKALRGAGKTAEDIWALSIGVTGPVDDTGRTTLFTPLPGWRTVDLQAHLGTRFTCPVVVENDCKLAALAERWRGAASDANDIVFLLAGMRMGAALIIDGVLRRGYGGAAGEIGALKAVKWLQAPSHLENCPGVPSSVDADDAAAWVFNAARDGNRDARAAVTRYVKDLAVGTAALVLALDPQLVVFGGGFSRSADLVLEPLRRELEKLCLRVPDVRSSALGADSVALGALRLAFDEVDERLFGGGLGAPVAPHRDR